jgi:hypothetical protein
VKSLYEDKCGFSINEEVVAKDGVDFIVTRGAAPSMSMLEQSLDAVKGLANEDFVAQDGVQFMVTHKSAPLIASLEESLKEAKSIYEDKCGFTLSEEIVAKDGVNFIVTRGGAPSMSMLEQLGRGEGTCQ